MRQLFRLHSFPFQITLAVMVGLLLGVACLWLSPIWMLIGLACLVFGVLILKRPEIALLGILVATSSIVYESRLPLIPIGIGSLHIPDILLLGSLGIIVVRSLVEPKFRIVRTPLDWPLLAFLGLALLSTAIAIINSSLNINLGLREYRFVSYYLTFFVVTNLLREEKQLRFLMRGIFTLATIVAAAMVAQFMVGESISFLPGRVESLQTQDVTYTGITRILPPGQSIILVAFIAITFILVLDRTKPITIPGLIQWGLLGLAVLVTFTRSFWVQIGLAVLFLAYLIRDRGWQRLAGLGLVVLSLAVITLISAFGMPDSRLARLTMASVERLATLSSGETKDENSLQFRYAENEYVLPQIISHPVLGLGLGAFYRPYDPRLDFGTEKVVTDGFIHNAHFWVMMKAGLPAYLCFIWLSVAFLFRSFKYWRLVPDSWMMTCVLGFALIYLGVVIGAVFRPMFMQWFWTPVIGIMMGFNEAILRKYIQEK